MTDHLPAVRRLRDENKWGSIKIGKALGISDDAALRLLRKLKLEDAQRAGSISIVTGSLSGSILAQYAAACRTLAEATRADEIIGAREALEHVKLYGRQVKDRTLVADATAFQLRADRKLGEMINSAEADGLIRAGRPKKNPPTSEGFTLAEAGVDYKTSSRAQKTASISERAFEAMVEATRERIISGRATKITGETINGARSVMGSRVEPDDSLDFFPTPPWSTRALMEIVYPKVCGFPHAGFTSGLSVWEPACGEGHMSEVLKEYFGEVWATDIHQYAADVIVHDFIAEQTISIPDWIITNPPFGDNTIPFILRAVELARVGVAMFLRLQILETIERYEKIFKPHPPTLIAFFAERVNLCKGRWDPNGGTATAYCWLVWMKDRAPMAPFWIPPGQREALTKPDDRARFAAWSMPHDPETGEVTEAAE
jgi:hypothetical protein